MAYKAAIIGSFRKHYEEVIKIIGNLQAMGITVLSPRGSNVSNWIDQFVVFETDNPDYTPEEIQMITLEKILNSDAVYVCDPEGYVGKTTSYEIGFLYSRRKPLYFLTHPKDLPLPVHESQIVTPELFGEILLNNKHRVYNEVMLCPPAKKSLNNIFILNDTGNKVSVEDKKIVICGSMHFYDEMLRCQEIFKRNGLNAIIPKEENETVSGYDESAFREFKRKVSSAYLKKIREKDTFAVLIYNGEKRGLENYIGANTLVEIAMAFTWNRKIFLFNNIYQPLEDELLAWGCICLNGDINKLISDLKKEDIERGELYRQMTLFEDFG